MGPTIRKVTRRSRTPADAAARGDNEMILYLVSKGADVMAVNRAGQTRWTWPTAQNSARSRSPRRSSCSRGWGAKNNNNCRALAAVCEVSNQLGETENCYRKAWAMAAAALAPTDPVVTTSRDNLRQFCDAHDVPLDT